MLYLPQITEHGSNSSFKPFACTKKTSGRYRGPSRGPRRGVPGSKRPFHRGEMSKGKAKGQENMHSSLLSSQENERLVELLGRRCMVSEVTLIRRPIIDGAFCPREDVLWIYSKSSWYKRETPERRDMVQRSQMRLELFLLMSVKPKLKIRLSFSSLSVCKIYVDETVYTTLKSVTVYAIQADVFKRMFHLGKFTL